MSRATLQPSPTALRVMVCHKHPSSGRLLFLRFGSGHICGPDALPKLAVIAFDNGKDVTGQALAGRTISPKVAPHPGLALRQVSRHLDWPEYLLMHLKDFRLTLEVSHKHAPGGLLPVYLLAVAGYESPPLPPDHDWIELPDSFALPYLEREIMRAAYELLIG